MIIKRNEKFIYGLRLELAKATLPYTRDPCDVVVEMALRNEEMLIFHDSNKAKETQSGRPRREKFSMRNALRKEEQPRKGMPK